MANPEGGATGNDTVNTDAVLSVPDPEEVSPSANSIGSFDFSLSSSTQGSPDQSAEKRWLEGGPEHLHSSSWKRVRVLRRNDGMMVKEFSIRMDGDAATEFAKFKEVAEPPKGSRSIGKNSILGCYDLYLDSDNSHLVEVVAELLECVYYDRLLDPAKHAVHLIALSYLLSPTSGEAPADLSHIRDVAMDHVKTTDSVVGLVRFYDDALQNSTVTKKMAKLANWIGRCILKLLNGKAAATAAAAAEPDLVRKFASFPCLLRVKCMVLLVLKMGQADNKIGAHIVSALKADPKAAAAAEKDLVCEFDKLPQPLGFQCMLCLVETIQTLKLSGDVTDLAVFTYAEKHLEKKFNEGLEVDDEALLKALEKHPVDRSTPILFAVVFHRAENDAENFPSSRPTVLEERLLDGFPEAAEFVDHDKLTKFVEKRPEFAMAFLPRWLLEKENLQLQLQRSGEAV